MELTPTTKNVIRQIAATGARPFIVGGAVRDWIMDPTTTPKDIDIEVHGADSVDQIEKALSRLGTVDAVGKAFGVLKVKVNSEEFDVSFPRTESKTGQGHRGFEIKIDHNLGIIEALRRRDFTMNAMAWDPITDKLRDPFGGEADIDHGLIRHVSDLTFPDDPLRVVRAAQFSARFGLAVSARTIGLAQTISDEATEISPERMWTELQKALTRHEGDLWRFFDVLTRTWWAEALHGIWLGFIKTASTLQRSSRHTVNVPEHVLLAAVFRTEDMTQEQRDTFKVVWDVPNTIFRKAETLATSTLSTALPDSEVELNMNKLARRLSRQGLTVHDWLRLERIMGNTRDREWKNAHRTDTLTKPLDVPINGRDLIAAGMKGGPEVGRILKEAADLTDEGILKGKDAHTWLKHRVRVHQEVNAWTR